MVASKNRVRAREVERVRHAGKIGDLAHQQRRGARGALRPAIGRDRQHDLFRRVGAARDEMASIREHVLERRSVAERVEPLQGGVEPWFQHGARVDRHDVVRALPIEAERRRVARRSTTSDILLR